MSRVAGEDLEKGMAMGLAGAGAEVALVSRTEKELKETIEEIRSQGGKARAYPADVSKFDQISLPRAVRLSR